MIELDEYQDGEIIGSIDDENEHVEAHLTPISPSTRRDKFCGCVCVIGLLLVIFSGLLMISTSSMFFGFSQAGSVLNAAEDALKEEGLDALRTQIQRLDIPPIEGSQSKWNVRLGMLVD